MSARCIPIPIQPVLVIASVWSLIALPGSRAADSERWYKGNIHAHSLWSDGDDYPEMVAKWYKDKGYDFLSFSDHNTLHEGEKWIDISTSAGGLHAFNRYVDVFGSTWVETDLKDGKTFSRLKPLTEYRHFLEEPNRFLLMPSMELTVQHLSTRVYVNATNLREALEPQRGKSVFDVMQNNINAVIAQRERTAQPMLSHIINTGITAEECMRLKGLNFLEVYNGHPGVRNRGIDNPNHVSTERLWDIILTWRLAVLGLNPVFGIAVDDSHSFHAYASDKSNPGRGWVMVRAAYLTPENLIRSMAAGKFYASTGVRINKIEVTDSELRIELGETQEYITQFIGTRKGFDQTNTPVQTPSGKKLRVTHRYSDEVGEVLAEVSGPNPTYTFLGDEIYVRAKIIASRLQENPARTGDFQMAWTQPHIPGR